MINFNEVTLLREQRVLFKQLQLTWHDQHKIGLVGSNGSGKSSLFALLLGKLEPTEGAVSYHKSLRIAAVKQEMPKVDCSALDYVIQGHAEYAMLQQALDQAMIDEAYERVAELHAELAAISGYQVPSQAAQLLAGLGFSEQAQQQPVHAFSGGWQMRLNLAQALLCPSDALLLDEPTNHLDLEAIVWLEAWLQQYRGLLVLISHDRAFLDKIVNQIAHIHDATIKMYQGNYTQFEKQFVAALALQQATYEKQQRYINHVMKYVSRFRYKASKARQAQSRLKNLARLERVAAVQAQSSFQFDFLEAEKCPYPLVNLENVAVGYGDNIIIKQINCQLVPGDRIALLGMNGTGKSTLIKTLAGKLASVSGTMTVDSGVTVGYFAQHQLEALVLMQTALEHMQVIAPKEALQVLRDYLGSFGFSGDVQLKSVKYFSGGEKARLALALMVWQRPNLLLLDEPTNHLDMEMRMALTLALQRFNGAMLLISHDRYLIQNTVDRLWCIEQKQLHIFDGDLDDYRKQILQLQQQATSLDNNHKKAQPNVAEKNQSKRPNPVKLAALEKQIEALSRELTTITAELSDPALYDKAGKDRCEQLYQQQQQLQQQLTVLENEWLSYQDE